MKCRKSRPIQCAAVVGQVGYDQIARKVSALSLVIARASGLLVAPSFALRPAAEAIAAALLNAWRYAALH